MIAAAGDGSLSVAHRIGNAIRRVDPTRTPAAPCGGSDTDAPLGDDGRDDLLFHRYYAKDNFEDIHLSISRAGEPRFSERVHAGAGAHER